MKLRLCSTILAGLGLVGCIEHRIEGSGRLVDDRRDVAAFHAVRISDGLRAEILVGPQSLALHLDDNILARVAVSVNDGVLVIESNEPNTGLDPSSGAVIRVSAPAIDKLAVTNGAAVRGEAHGPEVVGECRDGASMRLHVRETKLLHATMRDGCHAVLTGTTAKLELDSSDGSDVDSQLTSDVADIRAHDGSDVRARVTKHVRIVASDGSDVHIHGKPAGRDVTESDGSSVEFVD